MRNVIKIKYTLISFIIGLIPFIIITSIINSNPKHTMLHSTTLICLGILTACLNATYTYFQITNRLQNKNHQ